MGDKNIDEIGPWVDVVFIQDWDATMAEGLENGENVIDFGDWEAMAEYMSMWDYGTENDHSPYSVAPWGQHDILIPVTVTGMNYVLSANWDLRYASLNRRPIND